MVFLRSRHTGPHTVDARAGTRRESHLLVGLDVAAGAGAGVRVGGLVVGLGPEGVVVRGARAVVQAGAHVHAQRAQAAARGRVRRLVAAREALGALAGQRLLGAPHGERALPHLRAQVEAHLGEARAVRVAAPHAAQRRRPQVQVAVLQQELALGLRARDEAVRVLVVPATSHARSGPTALVGCRVRSALLPFAPVIMHMYVNN